MIYNDRRPEGLQITFNPPFNVDEVVYDRVKDDKRFSTYGIPRKKTKSTKKNVDKKGSEYFLVGFKSS
ncbi:hypothetical protein SAMN05216583_14915 [Selenomonas sp. KH1T6]|nr:hypothetical protein SAMN05216583_14915 [Selenomonas ruminantium]